MNDDLFTPEDLLDDVQETPQQQWTPTEDEGSILEPTADETWKFSENPQTQTQTKPADNTGTTTTSASNEDDDDEDDDTDSKEETVDDPIAEFLKERGITDPSKIQFIDDDDQVTEVDFNNLTNAEKLNILREITDPGLSDDEKNTISFLRQYNLTFEEAIQQLQQKAIYDYLNEHPEDRHQQNYQIDDYSDDELYLADLKSKFPDLSDEELNDELDTAKINADLFKKKVDALRTSYKQQEDEYLRAKEEEEQANQQQLQDNLGKFINGFNSIALDSEDPQSDALEVGDTEKQEMMNYLLRQDRDGKSQLVKDLEDPRALIELAYYRTQGRETINTLTRYWKEELANARKENSKLQKRIEKLENRGKNTVINNKSEKADESFKINPFEEPRKYSMSDLWS